MSNRFKGGMSIGFCPRTRSCISRLTLAWLDGLLLEVHGGNVLDPDAVVSCCCCGQADGDITHLGGVVVDDGDKSDLLAGVDRYDVLKANSHFLHVSKQ